MSDLTIKTNNQTRDLVCWYDLTAKEQSDFDWLDTEDKQSEASFVRYRGRVYCMDEFQRADIALVGKWDGYLSDSYFSGVVLRYENRDCEKVIMGTFFS